MQTVERPEGTGAGNPGAGGDRAMWLTGVILLIAAALAWVVTVLQSTAMQRAPAAMPMQGAPASPPDMGMAMGGSSLGLAAAALFVGSWGVMMAAMMLPSAAPMIALYGAVYRNSTRTGGRAVSTTLFAAVYLLVWLALGIPIYLASVVVGAAAQANPAIAMLLPYALALVLVAAGAYQFSRLKTACMRACRSPLGFLMTNWRAGYAGSIRLAAEHAVYCAGCCWALMVVLVAAGAMSLPWVLLIAVVVFAEKILPRGEWTARLVGGGLILLGVLVAAQPGLAMILRGGPMG